jgi:hypothetical protein
MCTVTSYLSAATNVQEDYVARHCCLQRLRESLPSGGAAGVKSSLSWTAGLVVVGDEILSGKVVDSNINFLSSKLYEIGWTVRKVSMAVLWALTHCDTVHNISVLWTLALCDMDDKAHNSQSVHPLNIWILRPKGEAGSTALTSDLLPVTCLDLLPVTCLSRAFPVQCLSSTVLVSVL